MAYQALNLLLRRDLIAHLQTLALQLNVQPGPGGCGMSNPSETEAAFGTPVQVVFGVKWITGRVVGLWPSQQIPLHADAPIDPAYRLHLPLQTNEHCWSFHAGVWQQLEEGVIYRMNPAALHGAVNWGTEVRLHLMVDVEGA